MTTPANPRSYSVVATTQLPGNRITRAIRRWWLQHRINMIELDIEFFQREAKFLPLRISAYERTAAGLRIEKMTLQEKAKP